MAGVSYLQYVNKSAGVLRAALKEPVKSTVEARSNVEFAGFAGQRRAWRARCVTFSNSCNTVGSLYVLMISIVVLQWTSTRSRRSPRPSRRRKRLLSIARTLVDVDQPQDSQGKTHSVNGVKEERRVREPTLALPLFLTVN